MPENDRGIGSEGLEQGGPSLGNDYSRKDLGVRDAGDALTTPNTKDLSNQDDEQDTLNMDKESNRNLTEGPSVEDVDQEDVDLDEEDEDDEDLLDLDEDDEDEDDELDKGL